MLALLEMALEGADFILWPVVETLLNGGSLLIRAFHGLFKQPKK